MEKIVKRGNREIRIGESELELFLSQGYVEVVDGEEMLPKNEMDVEMQTLKENYSKLEDALSESVNKYEKLESDLEALSKELQDKNKEIEKLKISDTEKEKTIKKLEEALAKAKKN